MAKYDKENGLMTDFNESRRSFFPKILGAIIAVPSVFSLYDNKDQQPADPEYVINPNARLSSSERELPPTASAWGVPTAGSYSEWLHHQNTP